MILAKIVEGEPVILPKGADVTDGENVISYASLCMSESAREEWGCVLVEDPNPPRRLIPKSVIHERMEAIGKLAPAFTAIQSQPILFGRWFAPDWPNVYADDEGLLQVLAAIGCTQGQIEAVTAP